MTTENLPGDLPADSIHRILALDIGIGSFGIAVQERNPSPAGTIYSFPLVRSCELPENWAALDGERIRRRMHRTRQSHLIREKWLRQVFTEVGRADAILQGRQIERVSVTLPDGKVKKSFRLQSPGDFRLEREFPPRPGQTGKDGAVGDEIGSRTVYCGAALRCLLLLGGDAQIEVQGRLLEPWQVFKALHSAIQKRGYDPDVPWKRVASRKKATEGETGAATGGGIGNADGSATVEDNADEEDRREKKDEADNLARAQSMGAIIESLSPDDPSKQFPCFWEAAQMGLWSPEAPDRVSLHYTHHARSTKWADRFDPAKKKDKVAETQAAFHRMPAVFPRLLVEAELLALCAAAEKLIPELAGKAAFIAYGPTEVPYPNIPRIGDGVNDIEARRKAALAALPEEERRKFVRGKAVELNAALGQKAPTFDNRCVGSCALMPRFNVVKAEIRVRTDGKVDPESVLAAEVSFLLQLKRFQFVPALGSGRDWLTAEEIAAFHKAFFHKKVVGRILSPGARSAITRTEMVNWLSARFSGDFSPKPGQETKKRDVAIEKPKMSGRSRFSRPGLRILRALVVSGLDPSAFHEALISQKNDDEEIPNDTQKWGELRRLVRLSSADGLINTEKKRGLVVENLKFLHNIGATWEKLSVRDERLEIFSGIASAADSKARRAAIKELIGSEINPRIRHRLTLLDQILDQHFPTPDSYPDRVVLEFARDEFMGRDSERKKKLDAFNNQRREERLRIQETLGAKAGEGAILKHQLFSEQGGRCLFCGGPISHPQTFHSTATDRSYDEAEICHIVSQKAGGARAYLNLVLGCKPCNLAQGTRYHAVAFAEGRFPRDWDAFVGFIDRECPLIRPFKKKLLTTTNESEAAELVQKRTALQETAWIAKLTRTLICLKFGWPLDFGGQQRRIVIVTGSVTNRVAKKHGLYKLLGGPGRLEEQERELAAALDVVSVLNEGGAPLDELKKARTAVVKLQKAIEDKIRSDKRHHALDAMVLSFLPHWAGDPTKSLYFSLPDRGRNWAAFLEPILDRVVAEELRLEKPVLRETIYGMRPSPSGEPKATIRRVLFNLGFDTKDANGNPIKFSTTSLRKKASEIRDDEIRRRVLAVASDLDGLDSAAEQATAWLEFCTSFRLSPGGPLIQRVSCWSDKPGFENYRNMAKDRPEEPDPRHRGQWRRAKGSHRGQWLFLDAKRKPRIRAVKVFESQTTIRSELEADPNCSEIICFLQAGCIIQIDQTVQSGCKTVAPGRYRLGGVEEKKRKVDLKSSRGDDFTKIPITSLMAAGFRRVDLKKPK